MSHLAKCLRPLALVCLFSFFSPATHAEMILLEATIDGLQEVPPNASPGTGYASMTLDSDTLLFTWHIEYSGLLGTINNAHFHGPADFGVPAGVRLNIGALPSPIDGSATLSQAFADELLAGLWYINIHSTVVSAGEIRGQVQVVPEISSLSLAAIAVATFAAARWKRK